ncbi:MAG: type II CAAX endopeptidase family protein [Candidatus Acidiferrum sp.]
MKRFVQFARSVVPSDPFQLLFLVGSILLLICMQLRCFPVSKDYVPGVNVFLSGSYGDQAANTYQAWLLFSVAARFPIVLAGAAGLFICFWPGPRPVRRILLFVCVPAFAGTAAICMHFLQLTKNSDFPFASVLQRGPQDEARIIKALWSIGPALHMSVFGILLVLVFLSRFGFGLAALPLSLGKDKDAEPDEGGAWKRIQVLIWISIVGTSVLGLGAGFLVQGAYWVILHFVNYRWLPSNAPMDAAVGTALLGGIAVWAVGENRWKELHQFTRSPGIQFGMLGAIFPIVFNLVPHFFLYLYDRIHWATFEFGRLSPPAFSSYFQIPEAYYLWYLPAAAFEEIIWRGYLQPRFVHRFGIARGIFVLGLVWSAFHFFGDFQKTTDDYEVAVKLLLRLSSCVVMSYVFGWLTLRSASIWPAALCHGLQNVMAFSSSHWRDGQDPLVARVIVIICWGVLAFVLFRFWPPVTVLDAPDPLPETQTQPAV